MPETSSRVCRKGATASKSDTLACVHAMSSIYIFEDNVNFDIPSKLTLELCHNLTARKKLINKSLRRNFSALCQLSEGR